MYGKKKATPSFGVARFGISRMIRWSVSAMYTYSSLIRAFHSSGRLRNWSIVHGRLITWKPRVLSWPSCATVTVGIESISPSGWPLADASSRVKPVISPHGPMWRCALRKW